jgi:hypothetical protein
LPEPASAETPELAIPLPERPVAVGESWRQPHQAMVRLENGATTTIRTQQVFTLASVKTGVATIEIANQVLTPVHSPEIEARLIEQYTRGTARFDIDAGRVLWQQSDLDHRVVGFHGPESCVHYLTRSTERLLPEEVELAKRPRPNPSHDREEAVCNGPTRQ